MNEVDRVKDLCDLAADDDEWGVIKLLLEHPDFDINARANPPLEKGLTALHSSCLTATSAVFSILMAHPDIDVNAKDNSGRTPFMYACRDFAEVEPTVQISQMLLDSRVNINERDVWGRTPFLVATNGGFTGAVRWLIASSRKVDLTGLDTRVATSDHETEDLLRRFREDQFETWRSLLKELGLSKFPEITSPKLTKDQYREFLHGRILVNGSPAPVEHQLWYAIKMNRIRDVRELLSAHPTIDLTLWYGKHGHDTLLLAALASKDPAIISMVLAHPSADVNKTNVVGITTLEETWSLPMDHADCILPILEHSSYAPVANFPRLVTHLGLHLLRAYVASGKDGELRDQITEVTDRVIQSRHMVPEAMKPPILAFLADFKKHPAETRHRVRQEIDWYARGAATRFAMVIFLCDGLLTIRPEQAHSPTAKFFRLASKLPLELQMLLCNRVVGSMSDVIPSTPKERAFHVLAQIVG